MIIKGIDNGYGYTKDESLNIFKSAYTMEEPLSLYSGHKLCINSDTYWVGTGSGTVDINKSCSILNKLGTLTCLALTPETDFHVVAGLPVNQFKQERDNLRKVILSYSGSRISVDNGPFKTVHIEDVAIYPQSVATLYASNIIDDVILIDIGYRTVDIVLIQMSRNKPLLSLSDTYYCGMFSLYDLLSNTLNQKFELTTTALDMEHLLNRGLYIDGVKQDISFLSALIKDYYNDLFTQLTLKYPVRTTPILLTGGGAHFVSKPFLNRFPQTVIHKNNQFSNALGYYQIGLKLFN